MAISSWLMGEREDALRWFTATQQRPEWLDAKWVGALYPANTARIAADVERERQRRETAAKSLIPSRR